jgi:hypothetical protein
MKIFILFFGIFLNLALIGQTDTLYGSLNSLEISNGSIGKQIIDAYNSYYIFTQNISDNKSQLKIYKTDKLFNEQKQKNISIDQDIVIDRIYHSHANDNEIICLILAKELDRMKLMTLGISFDLNNIEVKAEVLLGKDIVNQNFHQFSYDEFNDLYYSIGTIANSVSDENILLELGKSGGELFLQNIMSDSPQINLATTKINEYYFISVFGSNSSSLISEELVSVFTYKNEFTFVENDITYIGNAILQDCFENNGTVDCFGRSTPFSKHGSILMNFSLVAPDSFSLKYFAPLLIIPDRLSALKTIESSDFYYYVGTGENNPFNSTVDPNVLHISKVSKSDPSDIVWSLLFENGQEFLASDIEVDNDGNVLIVGSTLGHEMLESGRKNFYLKVFADGSLVSTSNLNNDKRFLLYPNPNDGSFSIQSNLLESIDIDIFDIFGRKVFEEKSINTSNRIRTFLDTGSFFIRIKNNQKVLMYSKMIVR